MKYALDVKLLDDWKKVATLLDPSVPAMVMTHFIAVGLQTQILLASVYFLDCPVVF